MEYLNNSKIRLISICLTTMLIFNIFYLFPLLNDDQVQASFSGEDATPPLSGDWVIDSLDNIVINETIILTGNLTIDNGGSLTFKNVTLLMNCSSNGTYHIYVKNGGSLYIYDYDNDSSTQNDFTVITSNTPDGKHRFYFWVRYGAKFEMINSVLHECGYESNEPSEYWTRGLCIETINTTIKNCIITNNYYGLMYYYYSSNSLILNSRISHNLAHGLFMLGLTSNHLLSNLIKDSVISSNGKIGTGYRGISIGRVDGSVIDNCSIYHNPSSGIYFFDTNGFDIVNSEIINNQNGIYESGGNFNNLISDNSIIGNLEYAIYRISSTPLNVQHNYFGTDNETQIKKSIYGSNVDYSNWLKYRESNILHINSTQEWKNVNVHLNNGLIVNGNLTIKNSIIIMNNSFGKNFIQVNGNLSMQNSIITYNKTNPEITSVWGIYPIFYSINSNGPISSCLIEGQKAITFFNNNMKVSNTTLLGIKKLYQQWGFLLKAKEIIIEHCNISEMIYGIQINSKNNTIKFCNISSNVCGVLLKSENNTIFKNDINKNGNFGIWLFDGVFNLINVSIISKNRWGIYIQGSKSNIITNCNFSFNDREGIYVFGGSAPSVLNEIYHNNFISNSVNKSYEFQACDMSSTNSWDNGYPSGGNYWDDYTGSDRFSGESQNMTGSDGIGDIHYSANGTAVDQYPLMEFNGFFSPIEAPLLNEIHSPDPDGTYNVTWSTVVNGTNYTLEEAVDFKFQQIINYYNTSNTHNLIQGNENSTYYYRVNASNNKYISPWSNIILIVVDYPPEIPRNLSVTQGEEGNALNVSWNLNMVDTINYSIWCNKTSQWQLLINISHPNNCYINSDLIDGQRYYYKVKAWDGIGQQSGFSKIADNLTQDTSAPAIPWGLKAITMSNSSISVSWNLNLELDFVGYDIYRSLNMDNGYEKINLEPYVETTFIDTNLIENKTYYYKLKAFDEVPNYSNFSEVAFNTTWTIVPFIILYTPVGNDILLDSNISIIFSKPMYTKSVEDVFRIEPAVDGDVDWNENNNILIFDPIDNLSEQQTYTVSISTLALDLFNNSLLKSYNWQFTTTALPKVIDYYPIDNFVRTDTNISITFNVEMNQTSVNSAFLFLPQTDGDFLWSEDDLTLIFNPTGNLTELTEYNVTIARTAITNNGVSLGSDFSWNFTTGELTAPQIIFYLPIGNEVPISTNISITFNEAMNKTSIIEAFIISNNIKGEFHWTGNTIIFTPESDLNYDSVYSVIINTDAMDISGNQLDEKLNWQFNTEKESQDSQSEGEVNALLISISIILIIIIIISIILIWIKIKSTKENEMSENEMEE